MRSRNERRAWGALAVLALAGALAAWWWRAQWLPQAGPGLDKAWRVITRPGPPTAAPASAKQGQLSAAGDAAAAVPEAARPRKCLEADGRITYTDRRCSASAREQIMEGGAVTDLPAR